MKIKSIISQHGSDFTAIYECEHCGFEEKSSGYDDAYFHNEVIPNFICPACKTKTKDNLVIELRNEIAKLQKENLELKATLELFVGEEDDLLVYLTKHLRKGIAMIKNEDGKVIFAELGLVKKDAILEERIRIAGIIDNLLK